MADKAHYTIIGAGICGLWIARGLTERGYCVRILEKSRGVGGRIATRRSEPAVYDHGAQFVKVRPDQVAPSWTADLELWFESDDGRHYASPGGLTQWPKTLSRDLDVQKNKLVTSLEITSNELILQTDAGEVFQTENVILTAPLPQSVAILQRSGIGFDPQLENWPYAKALVALVEVTNGPSDLKYLAPVSSMIFSVAEQKSKGVSPVSCLTITMSPEFSQDYFERTEDEALKAIQIEVERCSQLKDFTLKNWQLKKWRYSHPEKTFSALYLSLRQRPQIMLAGDAFGGPSVMGAIRSAEALLSTVGPFPAVRR